jgi:thiol-disulfide isomerase/thioredoxin
MSVRLSLTCGLRAANLCFLALVCAAALFVNCAQAQAPGDRGALVPQHLLGLVHAPQTHRELGLDPSQVAKLEALLATIDGEWFRSRILPAEQRRPIIAQLEQQVWAWLETNATAEQVERLRQLERRALSVRMCLRSDVAAQLALTSQQVARFEKLALATEKVNAQLQAAWAAGEVSTELQSQATAAAQAEIDALTEILDTEQTRKLNTLVGKPFDASQLTRIYPLAPELQASKHWINSSPLTLESLRGKVVLVHFYAFQCHNCHANFDHLQRWSTKWGDKVVVLGIQTPETAAESDPAQVRAAAKERGLTFPVLVDLDRKNWNAWANTMWPTVYVVDQNGYLRRWWQGELNWQGATGDQEIEQVVEDLLANQQPQ